LPFEHRFCDRLGENDATGMRADTQALQPPHRGVYR